jgi:hypothetical protein
MSLWAGRVLPCSMRVLRGQGAIVALDISRPHLQRAIEEFRASGSALRGYLVQVISSPCPSRTAFSTGAGRRTRSNSEQRTRARRVPDRSAWCARWARHPPGGEWRLFRKRARRDADAGYAHIEQCLMTALEVHYNKAGRFSPRSGTKTRSAGSRPPDCKKSGDATHRALPGALPTRCGA